MLITGTGVAIKEMKQVFRDLNRDINAAQKLFIFKASLLVQAEAKKNVAKTVNKDVKIKGLSRTGNLLNSIQFDIKRMKSGFTSVIGPREVPYAAIQEFGGIIRPRKAKRLWIPLTRRAQRLGPSKNKNNGLEWGRDFVLARRAVRKAKPYMGPALDQNINKILNLLGDALAEKL